MDQRVQVIHDYKEGESISGLAEIYGISRKTIYKWLKRHEAEGVAGLADRSRRPQHCPSRLSDEMIAQIVAARQRWKWGPRKLRVRDCNRNRVNGRSHSKIRVNRLSRV